MSIDFKTELGKIKILMLKGEKGDAGQDGSSGDYSQLTNKPTINGVTVNGAMTSDDLGVASETGLEEATTKLDNIIDLIYPVGSIYMSTNNVSPQSFIGGTWQAINGRFLVAQGSNGATGAEALNLSAGATGGEKEHTLTTGQLPNHQHHTNGFKENSTGYTLGSAGTKIPAYMKESGVITTDGMGTTDSGTYGQPHNNLPPYMAVYMWKRTA